jgi:hypothetical protein
MLRFAQHDMLQQPYAVMLVSGLLCKSRWRLILCVSGKYWIHL